MKKPLPYWHRKEAKALAGTRANGVKNKESHLIFNSPILTYSENDNYLNPSNPTGLKRYLIEHICERNDNMASITKRFGK